MDSLPRLPLKILNEKVLKYIPSPIGQLIKIGDKPEEVSKGLFSRVSVEVDVSKPLKRKLKYFHEGVFCECLLDYANITNICFGRGSQPHKLDSYMFNSTSIALRTEKFQKVS